MSQLYLLVLKGRTRHPDPKWKFLSHNTDSHGQHGLHQKTSQKPEQSTPTSANTEVPELYRGLAADNGSAVLNSYSRKFKEA
jgi:hypothetical protein